MIGILYEVTEPITYITQISVTEVSATQLLVTQIVVTQIAADTAPTYTPYPTYTVPASPEEPIVYLTPTPSPFAAIPQPLGQAAEIGVYTITLISAVFEENLLKAEFTVQNSSSGEATLSSLLNFEARDADGFKLDPEITTCGPGLDGKILPGDILRGFVCWEGSFTAPVKIYFSPNPFIPGTIVWEVSQ